MPVAPHGTGRWPKRLIMSIWLRQNTSTAASFEKITSKIMSPREFYKGLDEHVIGQHSVKVSLSVGLHNHLLRSKLLRSKKKPISAVSSSIQDDSITAADYALHIMTKSSMDKAMAFESLTMTPKSDHDEIHKYPDFITADVLPDKFDSVPGAGSPADLADSMQGIPGHHVQSNTSIRLSTGKKIDSVTLEKTNILLLGPTGDKQLSNKYRTRERIKLKFDMTPI